jgi:hypothetical protein
MNVIGTFAVLLCDFPKEKQRFDQVILLTLVSCVPRSIQYPKHTAVTTAK